MPPGPAWIASLPIQAASALARRLRGELPRLERPCISVGNLALGGRGKTPVVAALARAAAEAGLRPAVLIRGYGGRIRRTDPPELLFSTGTGSPWLQPVRGRAARVGEEPAWIAAVCPGVPVGVHPRRERAARAILEQGDVDLFVLDDGLQASVHRDLDVVLLDSSLDPPYARRAFLREGPAALGRAGIVAVLGDCADPIVGHLVLVREPAGLVRLDDGTAVEPTILPPVTVVAGVGRPAGVVGLARLLGMEVRRSIPVRDHGRPGPLRRRLLARVGAVLITEKDAMGWATDRPPSGETVVLRQRIAGTDELWHRARGLLGLAP